MRTTTSFTALDHIPDPLRLFAARRAAEITGLALVSGTGALALALLTWSVQDPSLNHATGAPVHNLLGVPGAVTADVFMQMLGLAALALLGPPAIWGWRLLRARRLDRIGWRILFWLIGSVAATGFAAVLPVTSRWPLPTGLGGVLGDALLFIPKHIFSAHGVTTLILAVIFAAVAILALAAAVGPTKPEAYPDDDEDEEPAPVKRKRGGEEEDIAGEPGFALVAVGGVIHGLLSAKAGLSRMLARRRETRPSPAPWQDAARRVGASLDQRHMREDPNFDLGFEPSAYAPPAARAAAQQAAEADADAMAPPLSAGRSRVTPGAANLKSGQRLQREIQPSMLEKLSKAKYQLPPLLMLSEPKRGTTARVSEEALQQNARLLEGVLDDFGVKGEIINVRPGPVVTLYELEPAPGIKSARVIGLADDIARSMSAVSARVAVVQGRNVIGIELPNQRRETVFLRELLASQDFETAKHSLAIALGKTIGGEPIIVDLARMPHLLVAGTTGSGKSVAINTMILSLLYRLRPDQCRLIMVDPKMLELSVYDGIPHLLTPVVTDPKKAIVALKWAVREMEDRYKKMSKLGVRNIDGFNAKIAEAAAKRQTITRTVQTGFDRETGEAVYEQEEMELSPLPYLVIIVDEMADLMMVAGKDIEGAIQRLAQMARAAGIHLIMATQRPSVDVITGTIKANFPTRVSFQVTSKIDSRTILGEQGAEQLLGQGDMLYMAGGGRIIRVHGPFVSDGEVEKIVAHLKSQGAPEYLDAITVEDDPQGEDGEGFPTGAEGEEGGDLYDRAVAIVLRDKKCSTSYVQRRLSVGYNKAASLVERMEKEGVVSAPNHSGKRTILVGGGIDRGAFEPGADY
ncbi:cell division protein FtsK [Methylovirgula ligni]|uniref:DNA translocase FtsK n=1 Tax=Methylovirgula ligni TaxID=569860 RepID=A0A3D9Z327_9HYPH|nr:DNA translocase FtsK 4TM domain-containing protein [Methylovirgula ligni]QAY95214.1 cell division protein FtsK [Methylovirgula ligni]REF89491.1 DNA translocase FtsK [Methylovirgula ligni]